MPLSPRMDRTRAVVFRSATVTAREVRPPRVTACSEHGSLPDHGKRSTVLSRPRRGSTPAPDVAGLPSRVRKRVGLRFTKLALPSMLPLKSVGGASVAERGVRAESAQALVGSLCPPVLMVMIKEVYFRPPGGSRLWWRVYVADMQQQLASKPPGNCFRPTFIRIRPTTQVIQVSRASASPSGVGVRLRRRARPSDTPFIAEAGAGRIADTDARRAANGHRHSRSTTEVSVVEGVINNPSRIDRIPRWPSAQVAIGTEHQSVFGG